MNSIFKVSAAVMLAAISALPAVAATTSATTTTTTIAKPAATASMKVALDSATLTTGEQPGALPVTSLIRDLGKWNKARLKALDTAASITVFDAKTVYSDADQTKLAAAVKAKEADLAKARTALSGDAGLAAWFAKNNVDPSAVVAIATVKGKVEVYTL